MKDRKPDTDDLAQVLHIGSNVVTVDYNRFAHHLADWDACEEQKNELIQAIANIVSQWVALGFNVQSQEQMQSECGQNRQFDKCGERSRQSAVESGSISNKGIYEQAAANEAEAKGVKP